MDCKEAIFIMTSNVANEEIAAHALRLRREAESAIQHRETAETSETSEEQCKEKLHLFEFVVKLLEISREFKEHTVEPILKVV